MHISISKKGTKISEKQKEILRISALKPRSKIAKEHISQGKIGSKNPMYGKHMSANAIKKKQISMGVKKVIQYDVLGNIIKVWDSTYEASKTLGINLKNIRRSCVTKYNAGGYKWKYEDR